MIVIVWRFIKREMKTNTFALCSVLLSSAVVSQGRRGLLTTIQLQLVASTDLTRFLVARKLNWLCFMGWDDYVQALLPVDHSAADQDPIHQGIRPTEHSFPPLGIRNFFSSFFSVTWNTRFHDTASKLEIAMHDCRTFGSSSN